MLRQELDRRKRQLCAENEVRLIEWPYDVEPGDGNVREMLQGAEASALSRS